MRAYLHTTRDIDVEYKVIRDQQTCGAAWHMGADSFAGRYLHFSADDLEPKYGWYEPLIEAVENGVLPAPYIFTPSGVLESAGGNGASLNQELLPDWAEVDWTTIPFLSRSFWQTIKPMPSQLHYHTDVWCSARLKVKADIQTVVRAESKFVHHNELLGRGAGMTQENRAMADRFMFENLMQNPDAL